MWWYNILRGDQGSTSHILWLYPITVGSILITVKIVAMKREIFYPILSLKITEWRKFVDCFGQSIEADPSKAGKKRIYFVHIGYIPRHSSVKLHISRHHLDNDFNL